MLTSITSKGQVTVPKAIRDQLKITTGTQLDFSIGSDNTIIVRPINRTALSIVGMLKRSGQQTTSIAQMNEAIAQEASQFNQPTEP